MMNFGEALDALLEGETVTRMSWGDERTCVAMGKDATDKQKIGLWRSKDHEPQVYVPSWPDMLGTDWETVAEPVEA